jgi:hypothetical protein
LKAKYIFIRAGELHIGNSETDPYNMTARITLHGENNLDNSEDSDSIYISGVKTGNRILANAGIMKMYGKQRDGNLTRLRAEVFKDATEIIVESGLDWVEGDRIALGPTSYTHTASEQNVVKAYNIETGAVTLDTPLIYHHWGQAVSTGDDYNGVDMRGEVILLSRSIIISGNDTESFGGQVLIADS